MTSGLHRGDSVGVRGAKATRLTILGANRPARRRPLAEPLRRTFAEFRADVREELRTALDRIAGVRDVEAAIEGSSIVPA